jgi:hypothetical protein
VSVPPIGPFATDVYAEIEPLTYADASNAWALRLYLDAIGTMFDEVETYGRDGPNGEPGWSILLDLNRAPTKALPWLGQFVGVNVPSTLDDATARSRIYDKHNFTRGTVAAIISGAQATLTGTKDVIVQERYTGDPYKLWVGTRTSQTPDSAVTLAALMREKPAGILLTYQTITGQTFDELLADGTFSHAYTTYATMQGLLMDQPGT